MVPRRTPVLRTLVKKLYPDEATRRRLFEEELPAMREMVREEIVKDFNWR